MFLLFFCLFILYEVVTLTCLSSDFVNGLSCLHAYTWLCLDYWLNSIVVLLWLNSVGVLLF